MAQLRVVDDPTASLAAQMRDGGEIDQSESGTVGLPELNDKLVQDRKKQYNEDDFLIAASDEKGNNINPPFRIPMGYHREVEKLVASRQFPFITVSDCYRFCVVYGIKFLRDFEPDVESFMYTLDSINRALMDEKRMIEFAESFSRMQDIIEKQLSFKGGKRRAIELLYNLSQQIESAPPGFWRSTYRKMFRDKWGHLIRGDAPEMELSDDELTAEDERMYHDLTGMMDRADDYE